MSKRPTVNWKEHPEKGNSLVMKLLANASLFFGRRLTRPIIFFITFFYVCFAKTARQASRTYLTNVLGRMPSTLEIYKHFLYFASITHDRLYLLAGSFDAFEITVHGQDAIDLALANECGAMLYGAHFGSFEVVRYAGNERPDLKVSILMYEKNSQKISRIFHKISPELAKTIIPLGTIESMLTVRERLSEGHLVGILADRSVNNEAGITRDFLGSPAVFPMAPFKLPKLFDAPALFIAGIYEGANRYRIIFRDLNPEKVILSPELLLANYINALEGLCIAHPFNWFNFYDFWELR